MSLTTCTPESEREEIEAERGNEFQQKRSLISLHKRTHPHTTKLKLYQIVLERGRAGSEGARDKARTLM
jgi:hypothetical protein